jgi:hypothetical protein
MRIRRTARRTARGVARRTAFRFALAEEDAARVEGTMGKPLDNLTEQELLKAMKQLGIKKLEVE